MTRPDPTSVPRRAAQAKRANKTMKWTLYDRLFENLVYFGLDRSNLAQSMSISRGATPLHEACFAGNARAVAWLVARSPESISVKNRRGLTPADVCLLNGHTALLGLLAAGPAVKGN